VGFAAIPRLPRKAEETPAKIFQFATERGISGGSSAGRDKVLLQFDIVDRRIYLAEDHPQVGGRMKSRVLIKVPMKSNRQ
jgi:hypothetical protein